MKGAVGLEVRKKRRKGVLKRPLSPIKKEVSLKTVKEPTKKKKRRLVKDVTIDQIIIVHLGLINQIIIVHLGLIAHMWGCVGRRVEVVPSKGGTT
ncbi:hypothetical protein ACLOJK_013514 [Asimina triloba]